MCSIVFEFPISERFIIGMNFIFVDFIDFNIRNSNVKFQHTTRRLKHLQYDVLLTEKAPMLIKIPNIHFDAFKTRSSIVFMTFRFGDVNVSSKKRHIIT